MNSTQQSTQYTAMYNTFKTYIHGKDIDTSYPLDFNKGKEKNKTTQEFFTNESNNKLDEKLTKSENNFAQNNLKKIFYILFIIFIIKFRFFILKSFFAFSINFCYSLHRSITN